MTEVTRSWGLQLEHRYAAHPEQVFPAWIDPDVLRRWWAAMPSSKTPLVDVDAREGGGYRLSMRTDEGDVHTASGE